MEYHILTLQIITAFAAGFLGAIAGGGGFITLPTILLAGYPPHMSLGTNKMLATLTTLLSASVFLRKGVINPKPWYPAMCVACISTIIGVSTLQLISTNYLNKLIPIMLMLAAIYVMHVPQQQTNVKPKNNEEDTTTFHLLLSIGTSSLLGFYSGFLGAGIGVFWTSLAMALFKLDIIEASGLSRCMCFITNLTAFILFMLFGQVNFPLGLIMGMTMACGSYLGANTAIRYGSNLIKPILMFVVIGTATYMTWKAYT